MMEITYDSFAANPLYKNHDGITEAKSELSSTAQSIDSDSDNHTDKDGQQSP